MADVRLNGVSKTYGGARANTISGFDLHINAHEFVVLVGPSGCGKSTMLRMIAGLEDLSAGEIWIGGKRVDELEPRERNIAMVFQNYALYPHMTVAQNMGFGLWLAGVQKDEIRRRVDEAAKTLGIAELMGRRPKALSGGQRQRVAMGRAMVRDPAVFLFDEPLSNLDANLRAQMRSEIRELHRRLNATTIYVTHDQVEAMTLADRVVVLNNGRIEQQGAPQELYSAPATRFVAGFIGSPPMNMLPGRLERVGEGLLLRIGEIGIPLPAPLAARYGGHAGRAVQVGIRPEHFLPDAAAPLLVVPVLMAEALGPATLIHFTLEGTRCAAMIAPEAARPEGESQPLGIAAERIVLFDPESGRAL